MILVNEEILFTLVARLCIQLLLRTENQVWVQFVYLFEAGCYVKSILDEIQTKLSMFSRDLDLKFSQVKTKFRFYFILYKVYLLIARNLIFLKDVSLDFL